ncbi:MAG TPA: ECF-type sigma factor [Urbifossiella sp.]|nr:ECF-type sigma factor [Urbifossiella sp.]
MTDRFDIETLMEGVRKGDPASQAKFFDHYFPTISRWVDGRLHRALRSLLDPGDIASTVCRTILSRAECGRLAAEAFTSNPSGVLFRTMMDKLCDRSKMYLQTQGRDARLTRHASALDTEEERFETPSRADGDQDVELRDQVAEVKRRLCEKDRSILDLRVKGHTDREIGKVLKISGERVGQRFRERIAPVIKSVWQGACGLRADALVPEATPPAE